MPRRAHATEDDLEAAKQTEGGKATAARLNVQMAVSEMQDTPTCLFAYTPQRPQEVKVAPMDIRGSQPHLIVRGGRRWLRQRESGAMAVDWLKVKTEYVNGGISYRKLAEKYGIPFPTLRDRAVGEGWKMLRDNQHNKTVTRTEQKTVEKISDALSDEAAAKIRIRTKLIRMAEKWIDKTEEDIKDTGDYRRIVQSCIDLGVMEVHDPEENDGDGLIEALNANAGDLFNDGDDSEMLPEEESE